MLSVIIGIGAQSTLGGGTKFLPKKYVLKITQFLLIFNTYFSGKNFTFYNLFYMILARKNYQNNRIFIFAQKIYKIPEFYMIFVRKMPEFYIIIARKIFFQNFRGHMPLPPPPSPTPMSVRFMAQNGLSCADVPLRN